MTMKAQNFLRLILAVLILAATTGCRKQETSPPEIYGPEYSGGWVLTERFEHYYWTGESMAISVDETRKTIYDADSNVRHKVSLKYNKWRGKEYIAEKADYEYNAGGSLMKIVHKSYDKKNVLLSRHETSFGYDEAGKQIWMTKYRTDNGLYSKVRSEKMFYDDDGHLEMKVTVSGRDTTYSRYSRKPDGTCMVSERIRSSTRYRTECESVYEII